MAEIGEGFHDNDFDESGPVEKCEDCGKETILCECRIPENAITVEELKLENAN